MAIISVGYDGAVTESQWSDMIKKVGSSEYGVVGVNDLKVSTVTAADRTVSISTGKGWGHGVFDENTTAVQVQLDTVASGSRWDLIAMRRDWTGVGGSSTFVKVNGTSAKEIPSGRATGPGVIDEQPIALVQITAGQTAPTAIVDLRVWSGNGGMAARDDLALTYLKLPGSRIMIDGFQWNCELDPNGNSVWTTFRGGYSPLFGVGGTLAGGVPPGGQFLIQAGTVVQYFDGAGYARITFPRPFPNGLLYVSAFNGDDYSTGGSMTFASGGQGIWGSEGTGNKASWVYCGRSQEASVNGSGNLVMGRGWPSGKIHRINWLAIGW